MIKKNYILFSVEELINDAEFVSIVKQINNNDVEWGYFIKECQGSTQDILQAREIILMFIGSEDESLSQQNRERLWRNISQFKEDNKKGKHGSLKKVIGIAASLLLFFTIGGFILYWQSSIRTQMPLSDLGSYYNNENPLLLLSNGGVIDLENKEPEIVVLKNRNSILLNRDSIVDNTPNVEVRGNKVKQNEIIVPYGRKSALVLSDGTKVWLNAGSRLVFPSEFIDKKREVFLEGEGYFEVEKANNIPFIVNTRNIEVRVLGTKFNLSAYASDDVVETVLLEGSVQVKEYGWLLNETVNMIPNQRSTYSTKEKSIVLEQEENTERYISWREGLLMISDDGFEQILRVLERFYNIRFEYNQELVSSVLPVTGKLDMKESLEDVMIVLSKVAGIDYQISGNSVTLLKKNK